MNAITMRAYCKFRYRRFFIVRFQNSQIELIDILIRPIIGIIDW